MGDLGTTLELPTRYLYDIDLKPTDLNGKDELMHGQSELLRRISNGLKQGTEFADSMSDEFPSPRFYFLSEELQFARRWIDGIHKNPLPDYPEKLPQTADLFRSCAEFAREGESHFLAEEFDWLASDASRLISEFTGSDELPQ